jgi:hypothetical protein
MVITIYTNATAVLKGAEEAGLEAHSDSELEPSLRWDIAAELGFEPTAEAWGCKTIRDSNSVYLSMGYQQWFAFDLETGDAAGFVTICGLDQPSDLNVALYLRSVMDSIGYGPLSGLKERR